MIVFTSATAALAASATARAPVWTLVVTSLASRATMSTLGPMVRSGCPIPRGRHLARE